MVTDAESAGVPTSSGQDVLGMVVVGLSVAISSRVAVVFSTAGVGFGSRGTSETVGVMVGASVRAVTTDGAWVNIVVLVTSPESLSGTTLLA